MPREVTPSTTLDNLKKEAKRWLKALRENDSDARERLQLAYPGASDPPVLRDVQHALAREYGAVDWQGLKQAAARSSGGSRRAGSGSRKIPSGGPGFREVV